MLHWFFSGASSGNVVTYNNWNQMVTHCYMSGSGAWGVSSNVKALYRYSTNARSLYAGSSSVRFRFPASSTVLSKYQGSSAALTKFAGSSSVRFRFPASSTAIGRYYPSSIGKSTSGSVHNLWHWSSNKSWYAQSSNVRSRFVGSSASFGTNWGILTGGSTTDAQSLHTHNNLIGGGGAGGYPSGPRHAVQYKSGTTNAHGGSWDLTWDPRTRHFGITGGVFVKGGISSQAISGSMIRSNNLRVASVSSQGKISGQWWTPIYNSSIPTPTGSNCGQIIRTSGSSTNKTYVWICVRNSVGHFEWVQLAIST